MVVWFRGAQENASTTFHPTSSHDFKKFLYNTVHSVPSQWAKVEGFFINRFSVCANVEVARCEVIKTLSVMTENHCASISVTVMLHIITQHRVYTVQCVSDTSN